MNFLPFQKVLLAVLGVAMVAVAWTSYGWAGVALVVTGFVMWALMHVNRMIQVLKRATDRPVGYVDSAVMLNVKLKKGVTLLHVLAMTRALGELRTEKDAQPEIFRWTDNSQSWVECEFQGGRLAGWTLFRPPVAEDANAGDAAP